MLGNVLNEFIDDLYHNPEKEISYHGKRYMVTGFIDDNCELYTLEVYTIGQTSEMLFKYTS